jgi:hypothetical protein
MYRERERQGSKLQDKEVLSARAASFTIWLLISFGMLFQFLFIPMLSRELPSNYVEFQGDGLSIQLFLSSITLTAQSTLFAVSFLLHRILKGTLINKSALIWVNTLAISCSSFSVLLVGLLYWLSIQGAAGPAIALGLIGAALVAAAFAFVTLSLKYVLKAAIANQQELEAVI